MVLNSQQSRVPGTSLKIGRGPITAGLLALAAAGTYFGINLVSPEKHAGLCAQDRCVVHNTAESVAQSGSTLNTLFLASPFNEDADELGYRTGTSALVALVIDVIENPTGASFDCSITTEDSGTGSGIPIAQNITGTGTIVVTVSGSLVGPDRGIACNTTDNITSSTRLEADGLFLQSAVEN